MTEEKDVAGEWLSTVWAMVGDLINDKTYHGLKKYGGGGGGFIFSSDILT